MKPFAKFAVAWLSLEIVFLIGACLIMDTQRAPEPGLVLALCSDASSDYEALYERYLQQSAGLQR